MLSKSEVIDILQLISSENLGPATFYKLVKEFGSAKVAINNAHKLKKIRLLGRERAEELYKRLHNFGAQIITVYDEEYPNTLHAMNDMAPILFALGNIELLKAEKAISIVGARNASINGRKTASRIAFDLTNSGIVVVSGMARGIDSAAHKGAMYACNQQGPTIAVLGTGIDIVYPDENQELYNQIAKQGCVVSEFPMGTLPQMGNFPRRNKIVAALSQGTLVVEASKKSGSLITAKLAAEYKRHIFAVPGAPSDARSEGPNLLIKNGAKLTSSANDIIEVLHSNQSPQIKNFAIPKQPELLLEANITETPKDENCKRKIIDYLNFDGVYVDEIIRASKMSEAEVALELLELEMDGKIERQSGNKVALIKCK